MEIYLVRIFGFLGNGKYWVKNGISFSWIDLFEGGNGFKYVVVFRFDVGVDICYV